jgi:hypothetical protein
MSFELFLKAIGDPHSVRVPCACVLGALAPYLSQVRPNLWKVRFDESNSCDITLTADPDQPEMVDGMTVHRPCADPRLWSSLASILAMGDLFLFFPGGRGPLVANNSAAARVPQDWVDTVGAPILISSGDQILGKLT